MLAAGTAAVFIPSELTSSSAAPPVVVTAAGDINNGSPSASAVKTGDLIRSISPQQVVTVGDNAYDAGTDADYAQYDKAWGSFKAKTLPSPGNHEYDDPAGNAHGYFDYWFGGQRANNEYRAYELGNNWLLLSLDTEISTKAGDPQETWLKSKLASHVGWHIWAYGHKPLFTSPSDHGPNTGFAPLWADLDAAGADIVMFGHNHNYQRFAPMHSNGVVAVDGAAPREVVCGTGGAGLYPLSGTANGSQYQTDKNHGVCKLGLYTDHWTMEFDTTDGPGSPGALDVVSFTTRTGGVPPSSTTSSSTSSSTSSTSSSTTSTSSPTTTTTTTTPGGSNCSVVTATLSGRLDHTRFPAPISGTVDATRAFWLNTDQFPVTFAAQPNSCWRGGIWFGTWPQQTPWDTFHHTGALNAKGGAPNLTVSRTTVVNWGDGYRFEGGAPNWTLDHVRATLLHDDTVENDWNQSGTVRDSLLEGYVGYSARASAGQGGDGSGNLVVFDHSLVRAMPTLTVFKGAPNGTGPWFKMDDQTPSRSPKMWLVGNTFRADKLPNHGSFDLPKEVAACADNTIIWLGGGTFPGKASWQARCTNTKFTSDPGAWDRAYLAWASH